MREIAKEERYDSGAAPSEDEQVLDLQEQIPPGVDGRIIRLANTILQGAIDQRASDIHLEPFENDVRVRYRVDGELIEITPPPKSMFVPLISRFKILSKMDIAEKRIAQDGAFGARAARCGWIFASARCPRCTARRWSCDCSAAAARART